MLYHLTTSSCAKLAQLIGLEPGFACAETMQSEGLAQHLLSGGRREDYDLFQDDDLDIARYEFNDLLNLHRPRGYPGHDDSIFFWTNFADALRWASDTNRRGEPILEVNPEKVGCECFVANNRLVEDLFQEVAGNIQRTEQCIEGENFESDDLELHQICDDLDAMARSYYATMKTYDGKDHPGKEILCPCDTPPDAIVGTRPAR